MKQFIYLIESGWTAVLFRSNEYNWNAFQSFFTKKLKLKLKLNRK